MSTITPVENFVKENTFKKVLVVDDDPIQQAKVQSYFESRGTEQVLQAGDGREALDVLGEQGEAIDLVVSDINMPELDGVEFFAGIQDRDYSGPIIIISGTIDVVVKMAKKMGETNNLNIVGSLHKPFFPEDLDSLIAELWAGK